jgi:hypothetical protein
VEPVVVVCSVKLLTNSLEVALVAIELLQPQDMALVIEDMAKIEDRVQKKFL